MADEQDKVEIDQEGAEQARDLAAAQEASPSIRQTGVTAADRLDEGDLSESDEEALRD